MSTELAKKLIPIDIRESKEELFEIADRAMKVLDANHGIDVKHPEVALSVTYTFLKNMIKDMAESKVDGAGVQINFCNLFDMGISLRVNDEAEKEGNYTPFFEVSDQAKKLVKGSK